VLHTEIQLTMGGVRNFCEMVLPRFSLLSCRRISYWNRKLGWNISKCCFIG